MAFSSKILVLNGPNLNLLGEREPEIYGSATYADLIYLCEQTAKEVNVKIECRQSNHEGVLVEWIQQANQGFRGIVINAGAYTHTSIALRDALKTCALPLIEVHISNIFAREAFRYHSYLSDIAHGVICGLGIDVYAYALRSLSKLLVVPSRKKS